MSKQRKNGWQIFFFSSQLLLLAALYQQGATAYMKGVGANMVLWSVYSWFTVIHRFYVPVYVQGLLALTLLADGVGGLYFNLYVTSTVFDKIVHIVGAYVFALLAYGLVAQCLQQPVPRTVQSMLIISLGLSIGAGYEIMEFFTDLYTQAQPCPLPPSQPSLADTDLDMVCDLIGAVGGAMHAARCPSLYRPPVD